MQHGFSAAVVQDGRDVEHRHHSPLCLGDFFRVQLGALLEPCDRWVEVVQLDPGEEHVLEEEEDGWDG